MTNDSNQGEGVIRVEHILAALDQIAVLSAQVREAMSGMHPHTVITTVKVSATGSKVLAGHCHVQADQVEGVSRADGMIPPAREASLRNVRLLEVILTANCNLRCGYCFQNAKQGRRMEWETLRASLDIVLRSDAPEVTVLFWGEPLLEAPLIRRAVAYIEGERPAGKQVGYTISTNGLLLDEDTAAFLAEHRFETQLSFDGVPAAQDLRGPGTHARLDALLERLRSDHPLFYRRDFR